MQPASPSRRLIRPFIVLTLLLAVVSPAISSLSAAIVSDKTRVEIATHAPVDSCKSVPPNAQSKQQNAGGGESLEDERKPLVLLYEYNPWAMVLGSDSPAFALYDDGLLIFIASNSEGRAEYVSHVLSETELADFMAALPVKQFYELRPDYELDSMTDQPTNVITVWDKERWKTVRVYGNLQRAGRDGDPQAFIEIYGKLKSYSDKRATRWMPERVELMIWPFENAGTPLLWPKSWPDTTHPTTKKRNSNKDSINYSIYLTPSHYESLRKQIESKGADALLINKRKWAFSFRFPFPNEDSWRKRAFDS
jgi:hypothetical protein